MSNISTHVLDTARGLPAPGVSVTLARRTAPDRWETLTTTATDADGRVKALLPAGTALSAGIFRLSFGTGDYFKKQSIAAFFPAVEIVFEIADASRHHHVPLLLSPFGYSTYRGS